MEHVCSIRKDECLFIDPNLEEDHEEDAPLFSNFPSPFFDEFSTIPIPEIKHIHQQHKPLNISETSPSPSETKCLNKRSTGKRDRHSKIYTAQGLRDRRMRLSLHIARKFFDLQDLLGFDKASETIEWLFCKSNKAIKEVSENFNLQQTNYQSASEEIRNVIKIAMNKPDNSKEDEIKNKKYSRKQIRNNYSIKETRDQARARARDRTRKRLMIKELEKSNQFFRGNPKDEFRKLGLGYLMSPNNHSSPSEQMQQEVSSSHSFEQYPGTTLHLLQDLQSATIHVNSSEKYSGSIVGASTYRNHNPPEGWLNSSNGFLRVPGELDADSFVTDCCNYGIVPTIGHMTSGIYEQNPNSFFMSTTTNILHFQSQNQGK